MKRQFENIRPGWIPQRPQVAGDWSAALATLEGHKNSIYTIAFSSDGRLLASGSNDSIV